MIKQSWTIDAFKSADLNLKGVKENGEEITLVKKSTIQVFRPLLKNKTTGEEFYSLAFQDAEGNNTFVGFSENLGEISAAEVAKRKAKLQIIMNGNYRFIICDKGETTWEVVDI